VVATIEEQEVKREFWIPFLDHFCDFKLPGTSSLISMSYFKGNIVFSMLSDRFAFREISIQRR